MVKGLKKLKTIEYFASFFIIFVFSLAVGKYYYPYIVKGLTIVRGYSIFSEDDNDTEAKKKAVVYDFKLTYDGQDNLWQLHDAEGKKSQEFVVVRNQNDGSMTIHKRHAQSNDGDTTLVARISGVHTYYSQQNGPIETEIPFDYDVASFHSFEQEDVVPIMGYHYIIADDQEIQHPNLEIHQSDFRRQVKFMTEDIGCRWFTFEQIMTDYILNNRKVPQKACVMNFDDGRVNNFTQALPILEEFGIKATFYIITDRIDSSEAYMTWNQLDILHRKGHEIGSHTVNSGSLISDLGNRGTNPAQKLSYQLTEALNVLRDRGYNTTTFAYPRGEWDDTVVAAVKEAKYVAARDIRKKDTWRDKRTTTVGHDDDFIWHMHYIKPEGMDNEQLRRTFAYDGWWQFEENYYSFQEDLEQSNIQTISSTRPTDRSYAVMSLKSGQDIENIFRVSRRGQYNIEFLGALSKIINKENINVQDAIKIYVDNKELQPYNISESKCIDEKTWHYCVYGVKADLSEGEHTLMIKASTKQILLDKFRMYRDLPILDVYDVKLVDVTTSVDTN